MQLNTKPHKSKYLNLPLVSDDIGLESRLRFPKLGDMCQQSISAIN